MGRPGDRKAAAGDLGGLRPVAAYCRPGKEKPRRLAGACEGDLPGGLPGERGGEQIGERGGQRPGGDGGGRCGRPDRPDPATPVNGEDERHAGGH